MLSARVLLYRSSLRKRKQCGLKETKKSTGLNLCSVIYIKTFFICLKSTHHFTCLSHLPCIELHPVLQLPGDVLVLPFSQVGDEDPGVEGTSVGSHPQLLNSFFLKVQEAYVVILVKKYICYLIKHYHI